ncbi:MAG: hypothetical protein IJ272_10165 [Clostridia bacterium]|nr:hypothetical protein [Clostridia bacterium]
MKYNKLKEIGRKKRNFERLCTVLIIALLALAVLGMVALELDYYTKPLLLEGFGVLVLLGVVLFLVFNSKQSKYSRMAEDYIIIKIMDLINENGIDTSNIEIIQEVDYRYRVGFHNQTVDYEDLQSKIDSELDTMNKIAGKSIRVKLI